MSLESADFIPGLVETNPEGTDPKSQGDDHLRLLKHVLKTQFPNFTGTPVTKTEDQINAGPGGASPVSAGSANSYPLGSFIAFEGTEAQAVAANLPALGGAGTTPRAWNTITHGTSGRTVQLSTEVLAQSVVRGRVFSRVKHEAAWFPWDEVWNAASLPLQSSGADITPGRVMLVGAFGLGANQGIYSNALDNITNTGFYRADSGTANMPPGVSFANVLHQGYEGSGTMSQLLIAVSSGSVYYRQRAIGGTWTAWVNLVGIGASGQAWSDQTANRIKDTNYFNSTDKAIQVVVSGQTNGTSGSMMILATGGVVVGNTSWANFTVGNYPWSVSAVIPVGGSYHVTGGGTINSWSELR